MAVGNAQCPAGRLPRWLLWLPWPVPHTPPLMQPRLISHIDPRLWARASWELQGSPGTLAWPPLPVPPVPQSCPEIALIWPPGSPDVSISVSQWP